jgi:uncharacterized protein (TIGR00251 family)
VARLHVHVTPRASRDAIQSVDGDVIRLRVTAAPTDGAANAAVVKLLARALALPSRDVVLVRGPASREKVFDIPLEPGEIRARLAKAMSE